ncbi:BMP family ABC transporter substrate-binding protein [Oscillospiraceae bacterium MB08-C2-2]|nr:BMP family ABC transporter substrate-binding protein [Oscillospiraceae bacterium MB08-C2-2]
MKKALSLLLSLVLVTGLLAGCTGKESKPEQQEGTSAPAAASEAANTETPATADNGFGKPVEEIGVALIINTNLGDKSFCDLSKQGLMEAAEEYGFRTKIVELGGDATKQIPTLTEFAEDPEWDIIVCGTYNIKEALQEVAEEFPEQKFVLYDAKDDLALPNVYSVEHLQNEGSYAVGAVAAMLTSSDAEFANKEKVIGFVAGGENTSINDFLVGYIQGAKDVDQEVKVLISYVGDFKDTAKAKEMAIAQINQGADVVFQVAGGAGLGVLEGAAEKKAYSIGVDSDQYTVLKDVSPETAKYIVTSMQKKVNKTVFNALSAAIEGNLVWGSYAQTGLADGAVGAAKNENFQTILTKEQQDKLTEMEVRVMAGDVKVQTAVGMDNETLSAIKDSAK